MLDNAHDTPAQPDRHQPVFNLPRIVVVFAAVLVAVHAIRVWVLSDDQNLWLILSAAFLPARYGAGAETLPVAAAAWWSPVTYAFIHGDWSHLFINLLWMAAFGAAVARRLGAARFVALSAVCAIAGAGLHLVFHFGEPIPVIGASAVVSGLMACAARFAFTPGRAAIADNVHRPVLSLVDSFANRSFLVFVGIWFALNFLFGSGVVPVGFDRAGEAGIAWQAHIGGFLAGLVLFSWFDRHR